MGRKKQKQNPRMGTPAENSCIFRVSGVFFSMYSKLTVVEHLRNVTRLGMPNWGKDEHLVQTRGSIKCSTSLPGDGSELAKIRQSSHAVSSGK